MNNAVICKNCNAENPFYGLICLNCKSYLREKIFNIDLWQTISYLIDEPKKAFTLIIQSEHKNFILFISFFIAVKLLINSMFLSLYTMRIEPEFKGTITQFVFIFIELLIAVSLLSYLFKIVFNRLNIVTRFKDNFALMIYSLIPYAFGLAVLFTVEVTVFGENVFSRNPSPFAMKGFLAYTLTGFEAAIILWSVFLSFVAFQVQVKNILYSLISCIVFNSIIILDIYYNSTHLF